MQYWRPEMPSESSITCSAMLAPAGVTSRPCKISLTLDPCVFNACCAHIVSLVGSNATWECARARRAHITVWNTWHAANKKSKKTYASRNSHETGHAAHDIRHTIHGAPPPPPTHTHTHTHAHTHTHPHTHTHTHPRMHARTDARTCHTAVYTHACTRTS